MGFLIFFVIIALLVPLIAWLMTLDKKQRQARDQAWQAFMSKTGLHLSTGKPWNMRRFVGSYKGVPVVIYFWSVSSGKSTSYYTTGLALFGAKLPAGLVVGKEGFGAAFAKMFGGQDIQLGNARLDSTMRIRGQNEREIKTFFSHRSVADAIVAFIQANEHAVEGTVTEQFVKVTLRSWLSDQTSLENLLDSVVSTVLLVENGFLWNPDQDAVALEMARSPHEWFDMPLPEVAIERSPEKPLHVGVPDTLDEQPLPVDEPGRSKTGSSGVEGLIAELRGQGTEEDGLWSIDRSVAVEKMRKFQLQDPESYILELIQAAQIKGATSIELRIDSSDLGLSFDGAPFTVADFDELYTSLLRGDGSSDLRALKALAIGLNAGRSLGPKLIHVRSGTVERGAELKIWPDREDEISSCTMESSGTEIHFEGKLRDVFSGRAARLKNLLFEACRFSLVPVTINEEIVSWDWDGMNLLGKAAFQDKDLQGYTFFSEGAPSEVFWVKDGVLIEKEPIEGLLRGFVAVVHDRRIKKDLSGRAVVRDEAHGRALRQVHAAKLQALASLAKQIGSGELSSEAHSFACEIILDSALGFLPDSFTRDDIARLIGSAPVLRTAATTGLSLAELLSLAETSPPVTYSSLSLSSLMASPQHVDGEILRALSNTPVVSWYTPPAHRAALYSLTRGRLAPLSLRSLDLPVDIPRIDQTLFLIKKG